MNLLSIVSFLLAAAVLVFAVFTTDNATIFFDQHAFLIVVGGSIAATAISFRIDRIFILFKVFLRGVIQGGQVDYIKLIRDLMMISEAYRRKSPDLQKLIQSNSDPFLKEAFALQADELLSEEDLIRILRARALTNYHRQIEEMSKFRTVGKYPPAFGLMGTTLSMISLLGKLGQSGGQKVIGSAMAVGLVSTFYGLALANLVFNPIAENLQNSARQNRLKNLIICEGLRLILRGTSPIILSEELNSFLIPSERQNWKKATGVEKAGKAA